MSIVNKPRTVVPDDHQIVEIAARPPHRREHCDWAITHCGMDKLPYRGKGQRVGVLDTGCDINHKDLKGKVTGASFISGNKERPKWRDTCAHGSFCTGEIVAKQDGKGIVGAASEATAFSARIIYGSGKDARRTKFDEDAMHAVDACVADGCGVISMSIGGNAKFRKFGNALKRAVSAGVIPIAAAGNERLDGSPYKSYPAAYPHVISVASANKRNLPAWFSTTGRGTDPDEQPEVAVASLEYYWGCAPGNQYVRMIGTSMATPLIAAMALLWREAREKAGTLPGGEENFKQFRQWLRRVADDTNRNGWDPELGFGVFLLSSKDRRTL